MDGRSSVRRNPGIVFPPDLSPREHLRRLRVGLAQTKGTIQRGAAVFIDSVKLLNRLNGRATASLRPFDFSEGNSEPSL